MNFVICCPLCQEEFTGAPGTSEKVAYYTWWNNEHWVPCHKACAEEVLVMEDLEPGMVLESDEVPAGAPVGYFGYPELH